MGSGTSFLQGLLGGVGPAVGGGSQAYWSAKDEAARQLAQKDFRKQQQENWNRDYRLRKASGRVGSIKEGVYVPEFEPEDIDKTAEDRALEQVMPKIQESFDLQREASAPPTLTRYTRDDVAGKTIPEEPFEPPRELQEEALAAERRREAAIAERPEVGEGALGVRSPQGALYNRLSDQMDEGLVRSLQEHIDSPLDDYGTQTVAQADTAEQLGTMVRPSGAIMTARPDRGKPIDIPSDYRAQVEATQRRKAAIQAAKEQAEQAKVEAQRYRAEKGYEGRVEGATITGEALKEGHRISAGPRYRDVSLKEKKDREHWTRVEEFGRSEGLFLKDRNGNVVTDKNGNPRVDTAMADAAYEKSKKVQQGGGLSPENKLRQDTLKKELDKALTEQRTAESAVTDIYYEANKATRDARLERANKNVERIKGELTKLQSVPAADDFDSFVMGE